MNLIKQKLTPGQERKSQEDLRLIDQINKFSRDNGFRIIISGGYAADGFFGKITRYHNDVDIQVYGTNSNAKEAADKIINATGIKFSAEDKGRKEYYHYFVYKFGNLTFEIYYLQTKTSPMGKEKFIVKSNGAVDEQEFAEPIFGKLNGISFEITDPLDEMKDKIYKREERGDPKRPEHEQDISNLKQALNFKYPSKI